MCFFAALFLHSALAAPLYQAYLGWVRLAPAQHRRNHFMVYPSLSKVYLGRFLPAHVLARLPLLGRRGPRPHRRQLEAPSMAARAAEQLHSMVKACATLAAAMSCSRVGGGPVLGCGRGRVPGIRVLCNVVATGWRRWAWFGPGAAPWMRPWVSPASFCTTAAWLTAQWAWQSGVWSATGGLHGVRHALLRVGGRGPAAFFACGRTRPRV